MKFGDADIAIDDKQGQIIFFEMTPSFGHIAGIIDVCLATTRAKPGADGSVTREATIVANLRCTAIGARELRDALNGALLMLEPVEKPDGPTN
jgi:hypothetical protein